MAKGEKSMERGQLMIVCDWITAHRINFGHIYMYNAPLFLWRRWLSDYWTR